MQMWSCPKRLVHVPCQAVQGQQGMWKMICLALCLNAKMHNCHKLMVVNDNLALITCFDICINQLISFSNKKIITFKT